MRIWALLCLVLVIPVVLATENKNGGTPVETTPVVIIGAGTAGIFAANRLAANGIPSVILEARTRTGGRMDTRWIQGYPYPVEMGCSFVHDADISPWIAIAEEAGFELRLWDDADIQFTNYSRLLTQDQGNEILGEFFYYWDAHFNYSQLGRSDREALFLAGYTQPIDGVEAVLVGFETIPALNMEFHDSTGWNPYDLGNTYIVPGGYKKMLDYVFYNYSLASAGLRLESEVSKIDYTDPNGSVVVTYKDLKRNKVKKIKATRGVIITLPIGVLRTDAVQFVPELPLQVQYSINKVSFGTADKVVLAFDWSTVPLLSNAPHNAYFRIPHGPNARFEDGLVVIFNLMYVYGQPVLQSFFTGVYAEGVERLSDRQIIKLHMKKIREFIPGLPEPRSYIISRWKEDEYAQGVYADYSLGTVPEDFVVLQEPFGPKENLCFAGEAVGTWTLGPQYDQGTTNQAAYTGRLAAQWLIDHPPPPC